MTRHRKLLFGMFALTLALIGVLAVALWRQKPEPVYQGKRLSEWVQIMSTNGGAFSEEYSKLIEAVGPNGIPFYLEWYLYKPGFLKRTQVNLAWKCHFWLGLGQPPD